MNFPTITSKNTKQEILKAYGELLDLIKKSKNTDVPVSPKPSDPQTNFRAKVMARVDEIEKEVEEKKVEAHELTRNIEELKNTLNLTNKIKISLDELRDTEDRISEESNAWEKRKKQLEKEFEDDTSWRKTRLEKELEQKKWEFENDLDRKNQLFEEEQRFFKTKVKEYEVLKSQVKEIPERIEKERKELEKEIIDRISKDAAVEQKLTNQQFDSDKKLLEQKISDLESQIKTLLAESGNLRSQLANSQQQMKDMAVAALNKNKEPEQ